MKIRNGFVSNSSSTAFVIGTNEEDIEKVKSLFLSEALQSIKDSDSPLSHFTTQILAEIADVIFDASEEYTREEFQEAFPYYSEDFDGYSHIFVNREGADGLYLPMFGEEVLIETVNYTIHKEE